MLWKNRGFFLIELLLSLSVWFMLSLFFIPLLIDLKKQAWELEIEKQAIVILNEELQAAVMNGTTSSLRFVELNQTKYIVSWNDTSISEQKEVCVKVENRPFQFEKEICTLPE